jgi:hypothetical protein
MTESRTWVLDTETKGTGAQMVPLDRVQQREEPKRERIWVPPKRRPRTPEPPARKLPRRFRVVDVVTREVLADEAGARELLAVLGHVEHVHDVNVFVWEAEDDRWRLLSLAEQDTVWQRRRAGSPAGPLRRSTSCWASASPAPRRSSICTAATSRASPRGGPRPWPSRAAPRRSPGSSRSAAATACP